MRESNFILGLTLLFMNSVMYSQVGIGTVQPDGSTLLDILENNIPYVKLPSVINVATITNDNVNRVLIYNFKSVTELITSDYYSRILP